MSERRPLPGSEVEAAMCRAAVETELRELARYLSSDPIVSALDSPRRPGALSVGLDTALCGTAHKLIEVVAKMRRLRRLHGEEPKPYYSGDPQLDRPNSAEKLAAHFEGLTRAEWLEVAEAAKRAKAAVVARRTLAAASGSDKHCPRCGGAAYQGRADGTRPRPRWPADSMVCHGGCEPTPLPAAKVLRFAPRTREGLTLVGREHE